MSSNAVRYSPSYTIADYALWEGDWELWNGVAVCMSPAPTPMHQLVATNIAAEIRDQLRRNPDCRCLVLAETDWQIDNATVVRPDVSIICEGLPSKHIDYAPAVVVEVLSPATEQKDRTAKKALYEQQGVRYYLIINPKGKTIEQFELIDGEYKIQPLTNGIVSLKIDSDCGVEFAGSVIFPT